MPRMNRRNIVIFCMIWYFAELNKCVAFNDESQSENSNIYGSEVTRVVEETQIEKPPIENTIAEPISNELQSKFLSILPMVLSRQKRSDTQSADTWKKKEALNEKSTNVDLPVLLEEESLVLSHIQRSTNSSPTPSRASRTFSKTARAKRKHRRLQNKLHRSPNKRHRAPSKPLRTQRLRAPSKIFRAPIIPPLPSDPSSTSIEPQASNKALSLQPEAQSEPNDNTPTSDQFSRPTPSEISNLHNNNPHPLPQPKGLPLQTLLNNEAKKVNRNGNDRELDPNSSEAPSEIAKNLGKLSSTSITMGTGIREAPSLTTGQQARNENCNHPTLQLLNEVNQKNSQPIEFLPVDYQHISESERDILKALDDDSLKYSELTETHADISHLLNSNCHSIVIGPSKDYDFFLWEHEPEYIADKFEERHPENKPDVPK